MAGVKVTDLPVLSTADVADIFYVVDQSTGESRQVDLATIATALSTLLPYVHLKGTAFGGQGQVTGDIEVDQGAGGVITLRFPNGDIIGLGVDYGGYSAISFYDATINETVYLYLRGGDLYLDNIDAGTSAGNLIGSIISLKATKAGYAQISVDNQGHDGSLGIINAPLLNPNNFYGTDVSGRKGWLRLPAYWARHCVLLNQSGTAAPTETIVETDMNGVSVGGTQNYSWVRSATGWYELTISTGAGGWDFTTTKPIVRVSNGVNDHVVYSTTISQTATQIIIKLKSFNSTNGTLQDNLLNQTLFEVELYS